MSKIFKRITAVFLSFLIMFWAVPNITEWAPMNDVSMADEDDESDVNVYDDLEEELDGSVVTINGYDFTRRTGELVIYKEYYFEELYGIAYEYGFSLSYDVKKITFRNGSRIVYGDDNSSDAFSYFFNLESVDMSGADASEFEYTDNMFLYCKKLKNVKLPVFSNDMTSAKGMFKGCESLETIDLSNYNASNLKNTEEMFDECKNLTTIKVNDTWNNLNITSSTNMFNNCTNLVGSNGTVFDASHTDKEYARIDTPDTPGYLTFKGEGKVILEGDTLILGGSILTKDVTAYANNEAVKKVIAEKGTVLPDDCFKMFEFFKAVSIDLSNVDSSEVTSTLSMFYNCKNLTELNLSGFNTSKVINMTDMFYNCKSLKSLDLSSFNTSNVTTMHYMFGECNNLQSVDLSGFNTSNVTDMSYMFNGCDNLQSLDLSNFDTSNVMNMRYMFSRCTNLQSLDLSNFDTSNVTNMSYMFRECDNLQSLDLSNFDTSNVMNMRYMFGRCTNLQSVDLSSFNTSRVREMNGMFFRDNLLKTIIVGNKWTASGLIYVGGSQIFYGCTSLIGGNGTVYDSSHTDKEYARIDTPETPGYLTFKQPDESLLEKTAVLSGDVLTLKGKVVKADVQAYASNSAVKKVVAEKGAVLPADCSDMFNNFKATSIDLSQADSSNVTKTNGMFYNCNNLVELNLSGFNTSKVISMSYMFAYCHKLKTLDLSSFNTSKVPKMTGLFYECFNLTDLDISSFDTSNVTDTAHMFYDDYSLKTIIVGDKWNTSNVNKSDNMFMYCEKLVGGNGTVYDSAHEDKEYARIDTPDTPGYLTCKNVSFNGIGDFDGDGIVDGFDMLLARKALIKQFAGSGNAIDLAIADVNGDNSFTIADIVTLGNYLKCRVKK